MKKVLFTSILFVLLAFSIAYGFNLNAPIEEAILKSEWIKFTNTVENDDNLSNDPVVRLLMGHAYLAANHNDTSLALFLSVKNEDAWLQWTNSLLNKHQDNPIAIYLAADAEDTYY